MRRRTAGPLVVCIALACTNAAAAQSPAPSADLAGQRVAIDGHSLAVTFPQDWVVVEEPMDGPMGLVYSSPGIHYFLEARAADTAESCSLTVLSGAGSAEDIAADYAAGFDVGADIIAMALAAEEDEAYAEASQGGAFLRVESGMARLPVGNTPRVDVVNEDGTGLSVYFFKDDETEYSMLMCEGSERPEDDWLSVAETFEFLPEEQ